MGGSIAQWLVFALPDPGALGSISGMHNFFSEIIDFQRKKLSMLPRLINSAVDVGVVDSRGLIISIKPI